jgi:hypothetical protein
MGGIYGNLPTDRFEVTWRLDDPAVAEAAAGGSPPSLADGPAVPIVLAGRVPDAPVVALSFPAGAPGIYRTDHDGTLRTRRRFAAAAKELFTRSFEVRGVAIRDSGPVYLLTRG